MAKLRPFLPIDADFKNFIILLPFLAFLEMRFKLLALHIELSLA